MTLKRTLVAAPAVCAPLVVQSSKNTFAPAASHLKKQPAPTENTGQGEASMHNLRIFTLIMSIFSPIAAFAEPQMEDDYTFLEAKVFAPAMMEQTVTDTPGAVTVITASQIKDLGLRTLADVMKLVPGFSSSQGPFFGINRGPNYPTARRLQVLIDGVSEVNPLVGIVRWENVPVAIENIERIEVIRSQASATFGANAFYGAINIITKNPFDVVGSTLSAYSTTEGNEWAGYARQSNSFGNTAVQLEYRKSFFDHYATYDDNDAERHDDQEIQFAKIRTLTRTNSGDKFGVTIAGTTADTEHDLGQSVYGLNYPVASMDTLLTSFDYSINAENHLISVSGSANDKDWDYHWDICAPKAFFYPALGELYRENPALVVAVLSGGPLPSATPSQLLQAFNIFNDLAADPESFTDVCGETAIDYHHRTYTGTISDIWQASDNIRVSSYMQFDYRWMESATYGNGKTTLQKSKLFTNAEFTPTESATINIGVFVESLGYEFSNPELSPRVGITLHLDKENSIKIIHSQGKRLIDGIEVIDYNQAPTYFSDPVYGSTTQSAFLTYSPIYQDRDHVETITSSEINYYFISKSFELEARYYVEDLKDILNFQDLTNIPTTDFQRDGVDLAVKFNISDFVIGSSIFYMNSSSNQKDAYNDFDFTGGSIFAIKPLPFNMLGSVGYYATSPIAFSTGETIANNTRFDLRLAKRIESLEIEAMLRRHNDGYNYGTYTGGSPDSGKREHKTELLLGISASI